jgi:hypothetical protein
MRVNSRAHSGRLCSHAGTAACDVPRGLDPDKWFNNVEIVIAERIGVETTTYVRNIYKYYVAYRLMLDAQNAAEKARQEVAPLLK